MSKTDTSDDAVERIAKKHESEANVCEAAASKTAYNEEWRSKWREWATEHRATAATLRALRDQRADMLAALRLYDEVMTAAWGSFDALPDEYSDRRRCWSAARAAIAKAEGREP